jgi:hypothetical protein
MASHDSLSKALYINAVWLARKALARGALKSLDLSRACSAAASTVQSRTDCQLDVQERDAHVSEMHLHWLLQALTEL